MCIKINYENENGTQYSKYEDTKLAAYKEVLKFCLELQVDPQVVPLS